MIADRGAQEGPRNLPASVRARLLDKARASGEDFRRVLNRFGMERFPYRVGASELRDRLLLKGANLFLAWQGALHRATKILDLLGFGPPDVEAVCDVVRQVCAVPGDDGPDHDPARRLDRNPLRKVHPLREPEPRNPTLSSEDEQRLLAACRPPWMRELVELLLATGMRPAEGLALVWSDLNPDQNLITVRASKTNKSRLVPVPDDVILKLLARRPGKAAPPAPCKRGNEKYRDRLFVTGTGGPISSGKAAHLFAPIARGLEMSFTLHGCRHVFASRMLSAGAGLPQIADILGHASLAMSKRYAHARLPDLQTLVEQVHARSRPKPRLVKGKGED